MYDLTACMVTYNTDEEVLGKIISCFQKLKLNFKLFISDNSEKNGLEEFIKNELSSISANSQISKLIMPWRRMFEVDMDVEYVD